MDKTPLENSIREESRSAIRSIKEKEEAEIKELDAACDAEIAAFKEKIEAQTRLRIQQEVFKVKNRGIVQRRKHKLGFVEKFITGIVDEAVKEIRHDVRYKNFLLGAISDALDHMQDSAVVGLKKEDFVYGEEIKNAPRKSGKETDISITPDDTIIWGGCIVHDAGGGRIFNSTIERICFRKLSTIRREVVLILKERGFAF